MRKHSHYALRSFVRYVGTFRHAFLLTCGTFIVADTLIDILPWLIGQLTASLSRPNDAGVWFWGIAMILASSGHDLFWRLSEFLYRRLLNARANRFDDIVFRAIIKRDYAYFADKFSGKVGSYATTLGREFREILDHFCFNYLDMLVRLPIIVTIMFTVNAYTGVIFVVSLTLMFVIGRKLAQLSSKAERAASNERSSMDGYAIDTIANFVSVKAFGRTDAEARHIHRLRDSLIRAVDKSFKQEVIFWTAMSIGVRWIIWPSTILLNLYLFTHHRISLVQITTFLSAIVLFAQFIWEIIWNVSQLNIQLARTEEAYRYLFDNHDIDVHDAPGIKQTPRLQSFNGGLELRGANFAYPDKAGTPVLQNINLSIRRGERIGIVGHSGGGKTTLVKLLLGYYPPPEGMLLVDGVPTDNTELTNLLAYVPQDTSLFHRSIRDNIAYSRPEATDAEIIAAAKHAQAHEFIKELADGYGTLVGERGIKLSGGQRQRIAIARAILKDAPILVLDEATSSLDSHSEALIQTALGKLMQDRTSIVIAHRLSTIHKMDRIIVLDKGEIAEAGTHAGLLQAKGIYAQLWEHQSGGFIEA